MPGAGRTDLPAGDGGGMPQHRGCNQLPSVLPFGRIVLWDSGQQRRNILYGLLQRLPGVLGVQVLQFLENSLAVLAQ
jgi:hypothetical protein